MRVFLDTSALFAGILSATGGARLILQMGEASQIDLILSLTVFEEIQQVLRRKAPDLQTDFLLLLMAANARIVNDSDAATIAVMQQAINYLADAKIVAAAATAGADYFVTLDKQHFLGNQSLQSAVTFPIGTPGDFLSWYRQQPNNPVQEDYDQT